MDISSLGIKVDSTDVPKAATDLDKLTKSAGAADKAAGDTTKSFSAMNQNAEKLAQSSGVASKGIDLIKGALVGAAVAFGTYVAASAGIRTFIDNTVEAQKVQAQLAAALKSTGGASGQTVASLNEQSAALQKVTNFGDEAIGTAQSILLTFTKIGGDTFPKATEAVTNLAERMGGDLQGAAIQVGKALNDPIQGVSALSRAGIQFTESQKEMIKSMVEGGNVIGAQTIVLKELETQFGGSAQAARDTLGGAIISLGNAFGDMFEVSSAGSESLRLAIENLIAAFQDPAVMAFVQEIGTLLFSAIASVVDAIAMVVQALPTLWAAIEPLLPLFAAVFGPTVLAMLTDLAVIGIGGVISSATTLFALLAANPFVALGAAIVVVLSYFVDWDNLVKNLTLSFGYLVESIGKALDYLGIVNNLTSGGHQIQIDAIKAAQDIKDAAAEAAERMRNGTSQGGSEAGAKMHDAVASGGASAAASIANAANAAAARFQYLNGVAQKELTATAIDGGKLIYNQATGGVETAAGAVKKAITDGGDAAAGSVQKAMNSGLSSSAQSALTIAGNTVGGAIADVLQTRAIMVAAEIEAQLNSQTQLLQQQASLAAAQASQIRQQTDYASHHGGDYGSGSGGSSGSGSSRSSSSGGGVGYSSTVGQIYDRMTSFNPNPAGIAVGGAYATGGRFTVGGNGGVDSQVVSFRATPGEKVTIGNQMTAEKAAPPVVHLTSVNLLDPSELAKFMGTAEGKKTLVNVFRSDPVMWRRLLGVS